MMSGAFFLFQPFPSGPGAGRFPLGRRRRRRLGFRSPPSWTPSASAVPGSLSLGFSGRRSHSLLERCWPSPWERLSPPDAPSLRPPLRRRRRPSPSPLGRSPSGSGGRSPLNTASRAAASGLEEVGSGAASGSGARRSLASSSSGGYLLRNFFSSAFIQPLVPIK